MKVGELFTRMAIDNREYRRALAREEGFTRQKAMTLGNVFSKGFAVAMGIGLVHGFRTIGGLLTDLITTAAKTETLEVAMLAVARSSGYPIPVLQQQRKEVMALGIAEQEATQMMTRFIQAQLDLSDAAKLARVAQDAGTVASMNSSDATAQMVEAIAKLRPELLTAFGFTRNLNDIYGDYARTMGKTVAQLSEVEKKQSMLNYIFSEGEKIAGAYDMAMGTVGKKLGSLEKLELSRKLMQELKTALARPLLLPAFGYWVDTITAAFRQAKDWVEANQGTLLSWGMTAKNVVASIVRGVQWVTNAFVKNWGAIRFAATALVTYAVATRGASAATAVFRAVELALSGQLAAKIPILGLVSTAVGIYKVQMALAAAQGIVLTGAIETIKLALYSLYTALGPVGWIILAISGLIAGGAHLWSKYSASVRAANEAARQAKMQELADKQEAAAKAAMEAAKGEGSLTDALKDAGKAAAKTLLPFDEIHSIQKDMAGLDQIGDIDLLGADASGPDAMFDFDMADFFGDLDIPKATFDGFMKYIREGFTKWLRGLLGKYYDAFAEGKLVAALFRDLWEWVKEKWDIFIDWFGETWENLWDPVKQKWTGFLEWCSDMWEGVKIRWEEFKDDIREKWEAFWDPIEEKWVGFQEWTSNFWETVKEKWEDFKEDIKRKWEIFWRPVEEKWNTFRNWVKGLWEPVRTQWNTFTSWARGIWDGLLKEWNKIKSWSLWGWIQSKVDWLKGIFDFNWSLPKIKMPKFTVTWDKGGFLAKVGEYLGLPGVPKLSVTWLAKGGILTKPTLFGFGGGEAGREAVLPLDSNTGWIDELAAKLGGGGDGPMIIQVMVGGNKILEEIIDAAERKNAKAGRTVIQVGV